MMGDHYEQEARSRRGPHLQAFLDAFAEKAGIPYDFAAASEHPYNCRCDKCLAWWASMGPDEDDGYGPFEPQEIEEYKRAHK